MTDRTITAAAKTETESASPTIVLFCELGFDGDPVNVWTGLAPIETAMPGEVSKTWTAIGDLGAADVIRESSDRRQNGVRLTLSGINSAFLSDALDEDYQGRSAKLWAVFLDENHAIIADPILAFSGLMDTMELADGDPTGAIIVQCESRDILMQRTSRSLLTNEEQLRLHPGDEGLVFVMELQSKEILWGVPSPVSVASSGGKTGGSGLADDGGFANKGEFFRS